MTGRAAPSRAEVFEEVWQTARDQFFDPGLRGVDGGAAHQRYAAPAAQAKSDEEFAAVTNQMLAELQTSHTCLYTPQEPEYFQLCGIFWPFLAPKLKPFLKGDQPDYPGIGIVTQLADGKIFTRAVLDGSPAAATGLKVGDEILTVDGAPFRPIASFAGKVGQSVRMQIKRTADAVAMELPITPKLLDPRTMFLDAMKASVEMIERDGAKIGYVHVWSYAGEIYQQQLEEELEGQLRGADALVLDLRDGWAGASPRYLYPFIAPPLSMTFTGRDGKPGRHEEAWTKPVCLLVNEGSKSGKEILACYFKKARRVPIVGSRTAGAVMAGRPFILQDGSLLFLAVSDGLVDGKRPEGNGVVPDVEVQFGLGFAQGRDPQKERAVEVMLQAVRH